ncbi:MAG: flagellin [Thermoanaerobacterales bacterium]|nr:flagellin [Bacillota bacterium]MDI6906154.1 flagellin [Thermoanaerobacterales bacterium]
MIINHNISALNAWRGLTSTNTALTKSLEKLSSGLRINRAADDAAGLAISEKMRGQIRGLNQAIRNAQDGISLIQTAEGALNESHSILQRMRELAVQSANDSNTDADRKQIQDEVSQLITELNRIADTTEFNTQVLMSGGFSGTGNGLTFHIGANSGQTLILKIGNMKAGALGVSGLSVSTLANASAAISKIQSAIDKVSTQRSALGAVQNRLEHTIANLGVASENLSAAESRVRDVDMAQEMMNFTKTQILVQAGTAMLAQANMSPQAVLKLLG